MNRCDALTLSTPYQTEPTRATLPPQRAITTATTATTTIATTIFLCLWVASAKGSFSVEGNGLLADYVDGPKQLFVSA